MGSTHLGGAPPQRSLYHQDVEDEYEMQKLVRRSRDTHRPDSDLEEEGHSEGKRLSQARLHRDSDSFVAEFESYTPDEERVVVKKLDRNVTLFMSFLYLLSFLDRSSAYTLCLLVQTGRSRCLTPP